MKSLALVGMLALLSRVLLAQAPSEVRGRVLDAQSGDPLSGADVAIGGFLVTTGRDGTFLFGSLDAGRYELRVRRVGYAPDVRGVEVLPGLSQQIEVRLAAQAVELDTITVMAANSAGLTASGEFLRHRGSNLGQALDGWEGIAIRRGAGGAAEPQVRGGAPDEVLVLLDGFPVNDPFTGRADLSRIPTAGVERVTLVPGAQGPREGNRAISGVINVETKRRFAPQVSGSVSSYSAANLSGAGSAGPATLFVAHEWLPDGYAYDVPPVRGSGEADRQNAGGGIWSFNGRVSLGADFTLRGTASDRGLPGPVTNPTPTAQAVDRSVLLGFRTTKAVELRGSFQWLSSTYRDASPPVGAPYDASTSGIGVSAGLGTSWQVKLAGLSGDVGTRIEGRHDRFSGDRIADDARFTSGAIRLDARLRPRGAESFSISPVVRMDMWTDLSSPVVSARADFAWQHAGTEITAGFGNGVTVPVLADLFFREGNGVRLNPDLRPERVRWEIEGGVRQELGILAGASLSVRGFKGEVGDMVLWGLSPAYGFVWTPRNFDVRREGGEFSLSVRPFHQLAITGSGTIASVTRDVPNGSQVLYRPLGTAEAGVLWQPGPWSFDARWHYIGIRYPNSSGINPLPAFGLFDAAIERRITQFLLLRGEVHDITDRRAEFIAGFPSPGRSFTLSLTAGTP